MTVALGQQEPRPRAHRMAGDADQVPDQFSGAFASQMWVQNEFSTITLEPTSGATANPKTIRDE